MNPKVSVIIPTFKRSDFLNRAIDSILQQTYSNIEILVIDDNEANSLERMKTENQMREYNNNNKVKYIKNKENLGGALARNVGIYKATGEYITFLDDDDIYLSEKINRQVQYMVRNNLDLSFTDVRFHNSSNSLIDYREHNYVVSFENRELLKNHIMHHLTPTATYMFKAKKLKDLNGFDNVMMGQEFMLMLKAIERNLIIGYLPIADVVQYIHDGERISIGKNKMDKEKELYNFKKRYFSYLSKKQRRYVKFRHHAVMMIVGKRSGNIPLSILHLLKAILTSPTNCVKEVLVHSMKLKKYK